MDVIDPIYFFILFNHLQSLTISLTFKSVNFDKFLYTCQYYNYQHRNQLPYWNMLNKNQNLNKKYY